MQEIVTTADVEKAEASLGISNIDENTRKAIDLHEEIVQAMLEKSIDPFERSYRSGKDPVIMDVTMKAPNLLQGTISLKYWREFSENKKYLEARSEQQFKQLDLPKQKKKKKSVETVSIRRGNQKRQDVRQPPSNQATYSFAAPATGFPLFDSHIIGPRNPVRDLIRDRNVRSPSLPEPKEPSKSPSPNKHLKPVITSHGDIGTPLPGGVMNQGRARSSQSIPVTFNVSFPTVNELDGKRVLPGGLFPLSIRFPNTMKRNTMVPNEISPPRISEATDNSRGRFSNNPRFPQNPVETCAPNPGTYQAIAFPQLVSFSSGPPTI